MCYSVMVQKDLNGLGFDFEARLDNDAILAFEKRRNEDAKLKVAGLDGRIYPGYYGFVIVKKNGSYVMTPMRYAAYPPSYLSPSMAKGLSTFNCRRDSLGKRFWSESFTKNHGLFVIKAFFEWVSVRELLSAGRVTLAQVEEEFLRQKEARKRAWVEKGRDIKKLKPTKAELKDPLDREIVISFSPESAAGLGMILPVIYSLSSDGKDAGFAILTDEPNLEIRQAGHDRMPICLDPLAARRWLSPEGMSFSQLDALLCENKSDFYTHHIA